MRTDFLNLKECDVISQSIALISARVFFCVLSSIKMDTSFEANEVIFYP